MDLDDLIDDLSKISRENQFHLKQDIKEIKIDQFQPDDEWGDTMSPNPKSPSLPKTKNNQVECQGGQQQVQTVDLDDDWGDFTTDTNIQYKINKKNGNLLQVQANDQQENGVDEWDTIATPRIQVKKDMESDGGLFKNVIKSRKKEEDEDDWAFIDSPQKLQQPKIEYGQSDKVEYCQSTPTVINGEKCNPLIIGGASLPHGHTESSMMAESCSSLKCYQCDKKVQRFLNASWQENVDYLFVRNHNTNIEKLKTGLKREPGSSAYACQCAFISTFEQSSQICEQMSWMCGGH